MSLSKLQEVVKDREDWCAAVMVHKQSDITERLDNYNKSNKVSPPSGSSP